MEKSKTSAEKPPPAGLVPAERMIDRYGNARHSQPPPAGLVPAERMIDRYGNARHSQPPPPASCRRSA